MEIVAGELFRKGTNLIFKEMYVNKRRNWQWIFSQNITLTVNSVTIGQNIQNEVSMERSIFANFVAYQFINLN